MKYGHVSVVQSISPGLVDTAMLTRSMDHMMTGNSHHQINPMVIRLIYNESVLLAQHAVCVCRTYATSMSYIRLSLRLSVRLWIVIT